jgi:carbamoylphosphate synthase large subunit
MFLVDEPYVSDFLKKTMNDNGIPVVRTDVTDKLELHSGTCMISESFAIQSAGEKHPTLYTTSENAIGWIDENLGFTGIPEKIKLFKDKLKFRDLTAPIFPDFFYQGVPFDCLRELELKNLTFPFIIKPAVGFFSMGVYLVSAADEWAGIVDTIEAEMKEVQGLYPGSVLDTEMFIIEECITGDEFAVDAYFNDDGEAVILNILEHTFASEADVSDRVYSTSKAVIENNLEEFTSFLNKIGEAANVRNFPVHLELRRRVDGCLRPIEVNPMRFGGWCTTADMAALAYGFNPYLYYYNRKRPDWESLLSGKEGRVFSIIVLDNSTGVPAGEIKSFDYDKLQGRFEKPLELRKIDYSSYPVFGFLFVETRIGNQAELDYILGSDLREFITE